MDKQHPYQIEIPKGYQYCPECELITPHRLKEEKKIIYPEDWICDICDNEKNDFGYCCPMCGWEHDPDNDIAPVTIKIKKHTTVCWDKQQNLEPIKRKRLEDTCDCPEVYCYPVQHVFNYRSSPQHWNMECSNAIEWSYDIMCKVCNYVFEIEDGNC